MKTIQLSCEHALFKYLIAQKTMIDGKKVPLFPGAFGIYGHGNVACIGQAMEEFQSDLPGYRGHHEQNMALTGIGYARAMRRKQIFIATSSVGPGATNMVTAAAVAMSNRLPLLLIPGDTFSSRFPDPVLQQVENFNSPTETQNDAFKSISKYLIALLDPSKFYHLYLRRYKLCWILQIVGLLRFLCHKMFKERYTIILKFFLKKKFTQ